MRRRRLATSVRTQLAAGARRHAEIRYRMRAATELVHLGTHPGRHRRELERTAELLDGDPDNFLDEARRLEAGEAVVVAGWRVPGWHQVPMVLLDEQDCLSVWEDPTDLRLVES